MGFHITNLLGRQAEMLESKNYSLRVKQKQRVFRDVWYRCFLKPFSRDRGTPYFESFKRRVLRPVGIPVQDFQGLHETFQSSHQIYSPLYGLIFNYNNFIENLYKYGDKDEPAVQLIRNFFHLLPGGEIHASHISSSAAAHISAGIVGHIFETVERLKPVLKEKTLKERENLLNVELFQIIVHHPNYIQEIETINDAVNTAREELSLLQKREENAASIRKKIKELEGDYIKLARHKLKRMKAEQKNADHNRVLELENQIAEQKKIMEDASKDVIFLRSQIVTSLDFKIARKTLRRAEEAVELEKESRMTLATILAKCFCFYDLKDSSPASLPKFTTTVILQAYIWRKYNSVHALKDYFISMDRMGSLNTPLDTIMSIIDQHDTIPDSQDSHKIKRTMSDTTNSSSTEQGEKSIQVQKSWNISRGRARWSPRDIETAVIASISKPGLDQRPSVIPFSYVTWAAYSEFPDCGEVALRNLVNQLIYNPKTAKFDYELLCELRDKNYPNMNQNLIDFYKNHANPQDSADPQVAREWIKTTSGLNKGREGGLTIRYRREKQEQNIASPLTNVLRVFNALMGIEPIDADSLPELVQHINEARQDEILNIDTSQIREDGFGIVRLTDGRTRYELQSYKPVHFGFVQSEAMHLDATGMHDYRLFRKLMSYSCSRTREGVPQSDISSFEQLALASIFVPYQLQRHRLEPFFQKVPLYYPLYFADLNSSLQQQHSIRMVTLQRHKLQGKNDSCCTSYENDMADDQERLFFFIDQIRSYTEPKFMPTAEDAKSEHGA